MRRILQGRPQVGTAVPSFLLSVAAATLLLSTLVIATPSRQDAQQDPGKVADPDTPLFMKLCSDCHDTNQIVSNRRTSSDWETVINKMVESGLDAPGKDLEKVFAFLNRTYGKVFINKAPADEIVAVLTITQKEAEAIVAYRKASGNFADLEALKKVPGIDVKKLEDKKDAITF